MDITVKDSRQTDAWQRQIEIEVPGSMIASAIEDELRKLRRNASLPGFRKGKVPMHELKARFGREVRAEVIEHAVQDAVREAIDREALELLSAPRVEGIEYEDGGALKFTAEFDVRPTLDLPDYTNLRGEKLMRPVDDQAVDSVLEDLRQRRARVEPIDRAAQAGDLVTADIATLGSGQVPIVGSRREGLRFVLDAESVPPVWIESIQGRRAGETVVVPIQAAPESDKRGVVERGGEERYYQLALREVAARELPALDDAFAREVGRVESLAALRDQIKSNLEEEEERQARRALERQLLDRLADAVNIQVPERIAREVADDLYETALKEHPELDDAGRERLAVEAQAEAVRRVRRELIVAEIRRRENIEVERAEAVRVYDNIVKSGLEPSPDQASKERMVENLRESLTERKVLSFLVDRADVEVIEQSRQRRVVTPFDP